MIMMICTIHLWLWSYFMVILGMVHYCLYYMNTLRKFKGGNYYDLSSHKPPFIGYLRQEKSLPMWWMRLVSVTDGCELDYSHPVNMQESSKNGALAMKMVVEAVEAMLIYSASSNKFVVHPSIYGKPTAQGLRKNGESRHGKPRFFWPRHAKTEIPINHGINRLTNGFVP